MEEIGDQLKDKALETGARLAIETASGYALKYAADLEGPLGLLLSEGLTLVTGELTFALTSGEEYKPGQWVFVNVGLKNRLVNQIPKVVEFAKSNFDVFSGEGFSTIPEELDYQPEAKHGIAFVLGKRPNGYEYSIFSFYTGREETVHKDKLRACPQSYAQKLDDDPDFSRVREVLFLKDHDPTLKSYVPTEKGQQVFFKGKPYFIQSQSGSEYVLVDGNGTTVRCKTDELVSGKTETSQRWDHDKIHLGHYTQPGFFSGEWVWVTAGDLVDHLEQKARRNLAAVPDALRKVQADNMVLAMVESIEGEILHVVRAYDGKKVNKDFERVFPASEKVQGLLDRDNACGKWKMDVLEGKNATYNTPGTVHPFLTLGMGEATEEELRAMEAPPKVSEVAPEETPVVVENKIVKDKLESIRAADEQEEDLMQYAVRDEFRYDMDEPKSTGIESSTSTLMLVLGVAALYMAYF